MSDLARDQPDPVLGDGPATHWLKTWPGPFAAVLGGRKRFDLRRNDRRFRVDDLLRLEEYDPESREYTGRHVTVVVTYVLDGDSAPPDWGIAPGYAIMSIRPAGDVGDLTDIANPGDADQSVIDARVVATINGLAGCFHANAVAKGFWDSDRSDAEAIALMHGELSEALESIRKGHPDDDHCPEFTNTEVEFADLLIRVLDTCHARGYRIGPALLAKHRYNMTRPRLHGKKF